VLGVLVITGEYATGSIRSTLAAAPQRLTVLAAKAAVFTAVAFATGLASSFAAFFLGQAIFSGKGIQAHHLGDPGTLRPVFGAALYLAIFGPLALGIGALARRIAGGIAALIVLTIFVPVAAGALPASWQNSLVRYLPSAAGQAIIGRTNFPTGPAAVPVGRVRGVLRLRRRSPPRRRDHAAPAGRLTPPLPAPPITAQAPGQIPGTVQAVAMSGPAGALPAPGDRRSRPRLSPEPGGSPLQDGRRPADRHRPPWSPMPVIPGWTRCRRPMPLSGPNPSSDNRSVRHRGADPAPSMHIQARVSQDRIRAIRTRHSRLLPSRPPAPSRPTLAGRPVRASGPAAALRAVWPAVRRGRRGRGGAPRVVLFVGSGFLAEGLALIKDPQCLLGQRGFLSGGGGTADVAFGQPLEHPDALDAGAGVQERADQPGDGQVARRVAQLAVLAGGTDQLLFFPVPQHPRRDPDSLGEPGDGHQLVVPVPLII
jgi:hypothetical protein